MSEAIIVTRTSYVLAANVTVVRTTATTSDRVRFASEKKFSLATTVCGKKDDVLAYVLCDAATGTLYTAGPDAVMVETSDVTVDTGKSKTKVDCPKCQGTGVFRTYGQCTRCTGTGKCSQASADAHIAWEVSKGYRQA